MASVTGFQSSAVTNANEIAKVWSPLVVEFLQANLVLAKLITDRSVDAATKGDTFYFPKTSSSTTVAYVEGGRLTDNLEANTDTNVTLTINEARVMPKLIPWTLDEKSKYDIKAMKLQEIVYGIAKYIDTSIANLAASGFTTNVITTSSVTVANLTSAFQKLNVLDVPASDRVWVFRPEVFSDLIALTSGFFIQTLSSDDKSLMSGKIGYILGSPVYMTTNLKATTTGSPASTTYANLYFHKSALGIVMLAKPVVESEYNMDVQGELVNSRTLFGVAVLDETRGVVINR